VWKKCRGYAASRHSRRKLRSKREPQGLPEKILTTRDSTEDLCISSPTLLKTSPYYDPFAHWNYEAVLPFGIPSHVSMPEIGSWYSNTDMKPSLLGGQSPSATGGNRDSDKEVHVSLAQANSVEGLPSDLTQLPLHIARYVSQTRVSDDQNSDPPTHRVSNASFRTISTHISSRISSSSRHANSVLSMTNSVRWSLVSAMSLSSRSSSISRNVSISAQEQWIRDMIVDEASIQPTTIGKRSVSTYMRSLHHRPCCKFNVLGILDDARCELCGFAAIHELFRIQWGSEDVLGDITTRDTFGNTPLHHAAAAGNLKRIENVLRAITASEVPLLALRNTSGETFLHVAHEPVDLFNSSYPAHLEIYNQFKVNMHDYYGRPVKDKILGADIRGRPKFDSVENLSLSLIKAIKALDLDHSGPCLLVDKLIDEDCQHVRLHMRNSEGLTALAIAAARGYPDIVLSLLHYGANPNARTRERQWGHSVLGYVAEQMQGEKDDARFSRMLCCANILADSGAKFEPTEFEEYCMKHVETAGKTSRRKDSEIDESSPVSEETRSCKETDTMITKRKNSAQEFKSGRWNPKPQVTSKAKKAVARLLVPATTSACPPTRTFGQLYRHGVNDIPQWVGAQGQPAKSLCEGLDCGIPEPPIHSERYWSPQEVGQLSEMNGIGLLQELPTITREPSTRPITTITRKPSTRPIRPVLCGLHSLSTLLEEHEMALEILGDNFEGDVNFFDNRMDCPSSYSTWHGSEPNQLFGQGGISKGAINSPGCWKCSLLATVGINLRFLQTCSDSNVLNNIDEDFGSSRDDQDISSLACGFDAESSFARQAQCTTFCKTDGQLGPTTEFPQPPEPPLPLLSGFFGHIPCEQHL
jgi:ankyrin repeat protein